MSHCKLILRIRGCPLSLPPFPEQVESVLSSKPLNGAGEEDGMCVLISRERQGESRLAQVTSAHRWGCRLSGAELAAATHAPAAPVVREPDGAGGAGEVPLTPASLLQGTGHGGEGLP